MILRIAFLTSFLSLLNAITHAQNGLDSLRLNYDSLLHKVVSKQVDYKTLSARTKMVWNDGETEQEFTGSIRIKKDSLIWMSLGMMGFEGVRVLLTPDSFQLLNRLTNEYSVRDFVFLQNWLLLPVNFKMLQQIIAGEKISMEEKAVLAGMEDSSIILFLESDKLLQKIWVDTAHYTYAKILLKDKLLKQDMTITFDGYNYSEEKPFSHKRSMVMNRDGDSTKLNMEIIKISFDEPLTFPFEVNEKYKRVE